MRTGGAVAGLFMAAACAIGCASTDGVVRVVNERPISGPFVPSEAYASYLRGAVAEAGGDLTGAIEGYSIAVALGPRDPEPWTRLGDARCARDPRDSKADDAIGQALRIDATYAPAWESRARCATRRGDARGAQASAKRAVMEDPSSVSSLASLADIDRGMTEDVRVRLEAMTLAAATDAVAWRALATWARGHGDALLEVRALVHLAPLEPLRGADFDADVARFAGEGELALARKLARARVIGAQRGAIDPLVARFAVDDAILAGKPDEARRLTTKGHLSLAVLAARALLLGDAKTARAIAGELVAADPHARDARFVLAAAGDALGDGASVSRAFAGDDGHDAAPISAEAWLPYARVVAREGSLEGARVVLGGSAREAMLATDPLTIPLAVSLAEQGVLTTTDLDANARIELAELGGEVASTEVIGAADARHRLLALARRAPRDPSTVALARRLAPARAHDAIIAVAFVRLSLAGAPGAPEMVPVLSRLNPMDPLVAAATHDCAVRRKTL